MLHIRRSSPDREHGLRFAAAAYQLEAGRFCQFGAVYSPSGDGSGTLQFYAWGALVGETTFTRSDALSGCTGLDIGSLEYAVVMRRLWLTDEALAADQVIETRYGATGSAPFSVQSTWDYGQIPPAIIGAPTPVLGSATQSVATPGLSAGASGYATLSLSAASTISQGTVQGWFYFPPTFDSRTVNVTQTILRVSGSEGYVDLQATPQSNGTWQLMTGSYSGIGFGKTGVVLSGWHNIAVTWTSDAQGILYLDGQLLVQDVVVGLLVDGERRVHRARWSAGARCRGGAGAGQVCVAGGPARREDQPPPVGLPGLKTHLGARNADGRG